MTPELKSCPHCGAKDPTICGVKDACVGVTRHPAIAPGFVEYWSVECEGCGAEGPPADTEAEAIAAWNQRTSPPAALTQAEVVEQVAAWLENWHSTSANDTVREIRTMRDQWIIKQLRSGSWNQRTSPPVAGDALPSSQYLMVKQDRDNAANAILPIIARREAQAWQDGAKAQPVTVASLYGYEAGWRAGIAELAAWFRDADQKWQDGEDHELCEFGIVQRHLDLIDIAKAIESRAIDPAQLWKDR